MTTLWIEQYQGCGCSVGPLPKKELLGYCATHGTDMKVRYKVKEDTLDSYLTVKSLIEKLKTLPQDLPVGRVGHFGEFYPMNANDFWVKTAYPRSWLRHSWEVKLKREFKVVEITVPDIGPEPD